MTHNSAKPNPLEPTRDEVEAWLRVAVDRVLGMVHRLDDAPAMGLMGAPGLARARASRLPIPEQPNRSFDALVRHVLHAAEASMNTAGPGYLAYVPGGGIVSAGIADLIANWINRYTGLSTAAPALCALEADVIAWLAAAFGYGERARGILTPGGSLANFSAVVTARHRAFGDDGDYRQACVYTSSQVHHSVAKSVTLAGVPARAVRAIATDARFRMRIDALQAAIEADLRAGRRPFLVVSSAGTTNTGAIDPMGAVSELCRAHGLWHHVDGAYGGAFVLCEAGRTRLAGIEHADSITIDPHKGMFLPYGTGCLLVRDGQALRRAHHLAAEYLQDFEQLEREGEPPSPTEYGPELSRDFRGLRVWLPLQLHGAQAFRDGLSSKLQLARALAERLSACDALELVDMPQLSVVAFRTRRRPGEPLEQWNGRTRELLARVNAKQRVYLSTTQLPVRDGQDGGNGQDSQTCTIRACILSFRTHAQTVTHAAQDIESAATLVR